MKTHTQIQQEKGKTLGALPFLAIAKGVAGLGNMVTGMMNAVSENRRADKRLEGELKVMGAQTNMIKQQTKNLAAASKREDALVGSKIKIDEAAFSLLSEQTKQQLQQQKDLFDLEIAQKTYAILSAKSETKKANFHNTFAATVRQYFLQKYSINVVMDNFGSINTLLELTAATITPTEKTQLDWILKKVQTILFEKKRAMYSGQSYPVIETPDTILSVLGITHGEQMLEEAEQKKVLTKMYYHSENLWGLEQLYTKIITADNKNYAAAQLALYAANTTEDFPSISYMDINSEEKKRFNISRYTSESIKSIKAALIRYRARRAKTLGYGGSVVAQRLRNEEVFWTPVHPVPTITPPSPPKNIIFQLPPSLTDEEVSEKRDLFKGGYFFPLLPDNPTQEDMENFKRDIADENLKIIPADEMSGNQVMFLINTLKFWSTGIRNRIVAYFKSFKDFTNGQFKDQPALLIDDANIKQIIRAILVTTGGVQNKAEQVRTYLTTLKQAARKTRLYYGLNTFHKYIERLIASEQYHLAGYALQFLSGENLDNIINIQMFVNNESTENDGNKLFTEEYNVKKMLTAATEEYYKQFTQYINANQNTPEFLEDTKPPTDTPFLSLYYTAGGVPGAWDAIPSPFGFFNYGAYEFDVAWRNLLEKEQLNFLTPTDIQKLLETPAPTFERLKRNKFVQMHLVTRWENKLLTINDYRWLLNELSARLTGFAKNDFKTKIQQIQANKYTRTQINNPEVIKNIYAIYDYLKENYQYEQPPDPDFIFAGRPMAIVGGKSVKPDDYLAARDWFKNGNVPPHPDNVKKKLDTGLNTATIAPPPPPTPGLLPTANIAKEKNFLNDTAALQARADAAEARTLLEVARDLSNRQLKAQQSVLTPVYAPPPQPYAPTQQYAPPPLPGFNISKNNINLLLIAAAAAAGFILIRRR